MAFFPIILNILLWLALAVISVFHISQQRTISQPGPASRRNFSLIIFFVLLGISLPIWRLSFLCLPVELDLDESEYLADALTFQTDWMPWRSVDVRTAGPLDSYVLMWPSLINLPISYFTARLTELAFIFTTLFFTQRLASIIIAEAYSLVGIFPLVTFYAFASNPEYVHYASEDLPVALLSLLAWLTALFYIQPSPKTACLLGLASGAVCLAKLQAAPLAAYLFIVAAILAYRRLKIGRTLWILYGMLILGIALLPLLIVLPVIVAGHAFDFLERCVLFNAFLDAHRHAGSSSPQSLSSLVASFFVLLRVGAEARAYLLSIFDLGLGFISLLLISKPHLPTSWRTGIAVIMSYLLIALMTVTKPGTAWPHYYLLILGPVLLVVLWLARGYRYCGIRSTRRDLAVVCIYLFVSSFLILIYQAVSASNKRITSSPAPEDAVVAYIKSMKQPKDRLAIWGVAPRYYTLTQLPSATRDVVGYSYMLPDPSFDYYRAEYVNDIERSKPRFLVDAVPENYFTSWPHPLEKARCSAYPPLRDYLQNNYILAKEIRHEGQYPILIYLRK